MFQQMKKRIKNEKGLTLIELLAVVVILAIIAAIAIPAIGNIINNSQVKAVKADALNVLSSANMYVTDNPSIATITYDADTLKFTNDTASKVTDDFASYVQSVGALADVDFTITNSSGKVTITNTEAIVAGGKDIKFNGAGLADIKSGSAETETKVTVEKSK